MSNSKYQVAALHPRKRAGDTREVSAPNKAAALAAFHEETRGVFDEGGEYADWSITVTRQKPEPEPALRPGVARG